MRIALPEGLTALAGRFAQKEARLYAVGGCVRNALLGLPYSDIDICAALLPDEVKRICAELGLSCAVVNKKLGTLHIDIDGETVEYTAFRRESYPQGGAHDPVSVTLGVSMTEDALRRDFSVNALYYDLLSGEVIDPTGKGLDDIAARTLSTTTADPAVIMRDDALRMLRLCRFAAELGFKVDKRTAAYVRAHSDMIHDIAAERIYAELCRLLLADTKYELPHAMPPQRRGLLCLVACGLFTELFPEFRGAETIGKSRYHAHSVLFHSIRTCELMPPVLELRLIGLLHDIGKCEMYFKNGNMHGHDELGARLAHDRLMALKASKKVIKTVSDTVADHMYDLTGRAKESTVRRAIVRMGEERFRRLVIIRRADVYGSGRLPLTERVVTADRFERILNEMHEQNAPMTLGQLNITGGDIIGAGIAEGSMIGEILNRLLLAAAVRPKLNTRERLLHEARSLAKSLSYNQKT